MQQSLLLQQVSILSKNEMIAFVITSYERHQYLKPLIRALERQTRPPDAIILVDNLSESEEMKKTLKWCKNREVIIPTLRKRVSLDKARNIGIEFAMRVFNCDVIFVSEDAVYPSPTCIDNIYNFMGQFSKIGIVGPTHQAGVPQQDIIAGHELLQKLGSVFEECIRVNDYSEAEKIMRQIEESHEHLGRAVISVEGHLRAFRRSMIEKIGLPDDQFEYGWNSDTEYCGRARHYGYETAVCYKAFIWHYRAQYYPLKTKKMWQIIGEKRTLEKFGSSLNFQRYMKKGFKDHFY